MSTVMIERHNALKAFESKISVCPYVDPTIDNMGLQKYNMALFDGIFQEEPLVCLEQHGVRRYVTGLNEFAPEVIALPDIEREAKIKQIREIVANLEARLAANILKVDDPEFWNKVTLLRPDNIEFWDKITLRMSNEKLFLAPETDPYDLIKLVAIEAGGFSMIAPSLSAAREAARAPKFYLDRMEQTASVRTEVTKLRNKAKGELQKLYDKNANKLMLVAKVIDPNSAQYKKSTPHDIMYENMDLWIDGLASERNKRRTAQDFLDVCALDPETLKLRAVIKDAHFYKVVGLRGGMIVHMATSTELGRNPSDALEFLKNPLNDEIMKRILNEVEKYWNK